MKPIKSFGVVAFHLRPAISDIVERIWLWGKRNSIAIFFHPFLKCCAPDKSKVPKSEKKFLSQCEALISVGGDGTFLSAIHMSGFSDMPVLGVNLGGLGFLTNIGAENLEDKLNMIRLGRYSTISRMVLKAELRRAAGSCVRLMAINDIFINRCGMRPKLLSIGAWYGDEFITHFRSDGLIVATPSGSTAYSLSAGGPIVEPDVDAFLLTPICPHSLTERPIILPTKRMIKIKVQSDGTDTLLSADGLVTVKLNENDEILICRGKDKLNLISLLDHGYFELLRNKLEWGKDYKGIRES